MAKYMDQTGAQHFAEALMGSTKTINGQTIWGPGNISTGGASATISITDFSTAFTDHPEIKSAGDGQVFNFTCTSEAIAGLTHFYDGDSNLEGFGTITVSNNSANIVLYIMPDNESGASATIPNIWYNSGLRTNPGFSKATWGRVPFCAKSITYDKLISLRSNRGLVTGTIYRITDYKAIAGTRVKSITASGTSTYLYIQAIANNAISPYAVKCNASGQVLYECLYTPDRDASLHTWIAASGHKGVIYWMREIATGNEAPFDFAPGSGIMGQNVQITGPFIGSTNCIIKPINESQFKFPDVSFENCSNCIIEEGSTNVYLTKCQNFKVGKGTLYIDIYSTKNGSVGDGSSNIQIGDYTDTIIQPGVSVGNNCDNILLLHPSAEKGNVYVGNNCKYIQMRGYNISVGNNCTNIYTLNNSNVSEAPSSTNIPGEDYSPSDQLDTYNFSVGNNCEKIGASYDKTLITSRVRTSMTWHDSVIGDNCKNISASYSTSNVSAGWLYVTYATFNNCLKFKYNYDAGLSVSMHHIVVRDMPEIVNMFKSSYLRDNTLNISSDGKYFVELTGSDGYLYTKKTIDSTWTKLA